MIKSEHLQILDLIVDLGSFKAAANALNISQPSISAAVKKFETELGFEVFDRSQYRPQLTEKGMAFYRKAKLSLESIKGLDTFAQQLIEDEFLEVHIAVDVVVRSDGIIANLYEHFTEKPYAYLYFHSEVLSGSYDKIISGDVDFAIAPWLLEFPLTDRIEKTKLFTIELIPVVSSRLIKDHNFADLINVPQIIAKDTGKKSNISYGIIDCSHKIIVSEPSLKQQLILSGYGWGRVTKDVADSNNDLLKIPADLAGSFEIDIYLMRNKDKPLNKDGKAIWDSLSQFKAL